MKYSILLVFALCAAGAVPAVSVSRWFTATFYDLRFTLRRYGHCTGDLFPLRDYSLNETEYLLHQIRTFLDQGNYEQEQLANVTTLMDNICRSDIDQSYPISVHIDVNRFSNNHTDGKANRCRAIDDALDSMFYVFRRAALNRSEPLDFSQIQFYPNVTDRTAYYNLTDLINTSWIKSETLLDHVCNITDQVKQYVAARIAAVGAPRGAVDRAIQTSSAGSQTSPADKRNELQQPQRVRVFSTIFDMIDRILDPLLGLQQRLYWESNTRLEMVGSRLSSGLGSLRDGFGNRIKSTRDRFSSMFTSSGSSALNATNLAANATENRSNVTFALPPRFNSTTTNFSATALSSPTTPLPPLADNLTTGPLRAAILSGTNVTPATLSGVVAPSGRSTSSTGSSSRAQVVPTMPPYATNQLN